MLYVIVILIALVLFLSVKLILIKLQLKRAITGMQDNPDKRQLNVDFVDNDLQRMIVEVNHLYEYILQIKAEGKEEEDKIRESISMISHDMRTPLTSIIGYLQVAKRSEDREEVDANIGIALERAQYLNSLVNDFFEISLIESEQVDMTLENVNLSEVICEEILAESPEIDRKGIEPSFEQSDENIFVSADKDKLVRIIQNLISNAVKYSDKRLEFRIDNTDSMDGDNKAEDKENVYLHIITDPGEKIDTDRIFDRFVKGDRARSNGGAGLGLYICKCFAEKMGGDISARQDDECFEIILQLTTNK